MFFKKIKAFGLLKTVAALTMPIVIGVALCTPASASGTRSFTHWDISSNNKSTVYSRDIYDAQTLINARSLKLDESITLKDIACAPGGELYILTDEGQILSLNSDYSLDREVLLTDSEGDEVDFSGSSGIYITEKNLYVADTANNRVLVCNSDGTVIKEIEQPESPVLPEDFEFIPTKLAVDKKGYLYVISEGAYYGALLFDSNCDFLSFYGTNTVNASVISTIKNLWDLMTKSDEKRGNEMKKLPYQFIDIALDSDDFVYTCTGTASGGSESGQLRRLSPGGSNILDKNYGSSVIDAGSFNFSESDTAKRGGKYIRQSFVGVQVDENGFIYGLDSVYGIIYVYDQDCNLITAFGGGADSGDQIGTFSAACALAVSNGKVFVADSLWNQVTVFTQTDYGKRVLKAQRLTLDGEYAEAAPLWKRIYSEDQNSRLALSAMAKASYAAGDYSAAKDYAKRAVDRVTYDNSIKKQQETFVNGNFLWIFALTVFLIIGICVIVSILRKRRVTLIKNRKFGIMLGCVAHPFRNFNDIRYKNLGSVYIAVGLTIALFASAVLQTVYTDFRFTTYNAATYNPVYQFLSTVGLIFLWSAANWAVSILQQGKGTFVNVFTVTAYSALPMIVYNIAATALSYTLNSTSQVVLDGLKLLAMVLTAIILIIGLMVIHEFSFPRFIITAVLTVLGMILIIFILFMIGMLLSQLWQFIATVISEMIYR